MKPKISVLAAGGCLGLSMAIAGLWGAVSESSVNAQLTSDSTTTIAQRSNQPVRRDEPINITLDERFSLNNALTRVKQIQGALSSFRRLTDNSRTALGQRAIASVGNTDPETQTLGFTNWVGAVEGALKQQDYQIKRLEYQLAQKQLEDRQISQATFNQKRAAFQQAERDFQNFLNSFRIAD